MDRIKNIFQKSVLTFMAVVLVASSLVAAPQVGAQGLPVVDSALVGFETKDEIEQRIQQPLAVALIQILLNLISFVANRLAYDAAIAIASGGKGQSPGYEYRSAEEYAEDLWQDVLGETVSSLSEGLDVVGVQYNLCAPSSPLKRLNIQLGIAGAAGARPEPRCEFREIQSNWEGFVASLDEETDPSKVFREFSASFAEGRTELSATISILAHTYNQAAREEQIKTDELFANKRFKDVEDSITGHVKTPATVLEQQFNTKLQEAQGNQNEALQQALFGNEGALLQIGVSVGSVFLNTLLSQLTNKIYSGLFEPPTSGGVFDPNFINIAGRDRARETFKGLLSTPIQTVDQYNVMNQFVTCPGSETRGPNNCVMDTSFAAIVARAEAGSPMTVQEALDAGLLHGDWLLWSEESADHNQDPFCYTEGYCYSNLVKMRIARILPVGWEIAANKSGTEGRPIVTLQHVVDQFNKCTDNPDDPIDANNPYCHLIDPNWVIKYPETQCRAQVYGQTLVADSANLRSETCVDTPSCIQEDENGNCVGGFGYCTRERNIWRFDGDVCPEEYGSCTTLTSRTGERDSFLTNTVDFDGCSADNAGCLWYRTEKTLDAGDLADPTDDTFVWENTDPAIAEDVSSVRKYLTANAIPCSAGDAGCTELIRGATSSLNGIVNPSFENDADDDDVPDGWLLSGLVEYDTDGEQSGFGTDALLMDVGAIAEAKNKISLPPNQFVTVSFTAKQYLAATSSMAMSMEFYSDDGSADGQLLSAATTPAIPSPAANSDCFVAGSSIQLTETLDDSFTRYACTISTPDEPVWMHLELFNNSGQSVLDGVQIDDREITSTFHTAYDGTKESVFMKVAPDYLGCTGDATDPEECGDYAKVCSATEVGCTAFSPTSGNPTVPGIINANDLCPSECVGYETYRQLATNFSSDVFPVYFIAESARSCSITSAGCAEFTNLDAVAEGGEGREYFTDVRVCQEVAEAQSTNTAGVTYYTWEGADVVGGHQLKTWVLKQSNLGDAPCTAYDAASGNCVDTTTASPDGCGSHADMVINPDCRAFYDTEGDIHYRYYSDTVSVTDECSPYRKTLATQSDCVDNGGAWNAASGNCTYNILASESTECSASDNGCRGYTGNTGNNTRIVMTEFFEDGSLAAWETPATPIAPPYPTSIVGEPTYSNESVATDGHSMEIGASGVRTFVNQLASCEPEVEGGVCVTDPNPYGLTCEVGASDGPVECGTLVNQIQPGFSYIISFWAKGSGTLDVEFEDQWGTGENSTFVSDLELEQGWQEFTFGPLDPSVDNPDMNLSSTVLKMQKNSAALEVFVDNIVLREVQDTAYLIENSWVTPATCDATPAGASAPQYYLGCEEYTTHRGNSINLKSFTSICREGAVGCGSFYDTGNSVSEEAQAFNMLCEPVGVVLPATELTPCVFNGDEVCTVLPNQSSCRFNYTGIDAPFDLNSSTATSVTTVLEDSEIVSRDHKIFLVDEPGGRCGAAAMGCTEFGTPVFNQDKTDVLEFVDTTLFDLPDTYATSLCESANLFCEAYSTDEGGLYYFKKPDDQTCEYRTGVNIDGSEYHGWFKTGVDEACYDDPEYLIGGNEYGIWRNGDADGYEGWVGKCEEKWHSCSEFVDVIDTADGLYPSGRPYHFLNNDKINPADAAPAEKCEGLLSQETGCVGFNNNAVPYTTFNASASYVKSWHADVLENAPEPFEPVSPVDCSVEGSALYDLDGDGVFETDLCRRFCSYPVMTGYGDIGPIYEAQTGGSCLVDTDCGTVNDIFGNEVQGTCFPMDVSWENGPFYVGICDGGAQEAGDRCTTGGACTGGSCLPVVGPLQSEYSTATPRLANDSNTVMKVRRDRMCSEWLACDSQFTAWDDNRGQYVKVCNSVDLCNEFSSTAALSFCSSWADEPMRILDEDEYATRDVTWYGSEYSGYSIPNQYGIQDYNQININPTRWCKKDAENQIVNAAGDETDYNNETGTWTSGLPVSCVSDPECTLVHPQATCVPADTDFRLAVALGPCATGTADGENCSVGSCSDTGVACGSDAHCGTDAVCEFLVGEVKDGQCYGSICTTSITGDDIVNSTRQECRGYPEADSPFPNEVVDTWFDLGGEGIEHDDRAQTVKQKFTNAELCANGERCECSYVTAEYENGTISKHFALPSNNGTEPPSGVCRGGLAEGQQCQIDDDCDYDAGDYTTEGTCVYKTAQNTFVGWNGFCIQYDGSINILGNQDKNACLMWLPVDQLVGGTDLYNKFTEAGFPINNSYYCSEVGMLVDLFTTGYDPEADLITPSCAETRRGSNNDWPESGAGNTCAVGEWDTCWDNVACPAGYFAIIGGCKDDGLANNCQESGDDDDCPYICVPVGSYDENGDLCTPPANAPSAPSVVEVEGSLYTDDSPPYGWFNSASFVTNLSDHIDSYKTCSRLGIEWYDDMTDNWYVPHYPILSESNYYGYRDFSNNHQFYLGCTELAFTSVEEGFGLRPEHRGNAAFTNRALSPGDPFEITEGPFSFDLGIQTGSNPDPVGIVTPSYDLIDPSDYSWIDDPTQVDFSPPAVAACVLPDGTVHTATEDELTNGTCSFYPNGSYMARGYQYYEIHIPDLGAGSCSTDADCGLDYSTEGTCDDSANNRQACFIECGEFALKYNPAAQSYLPADEDWTLAHGSAFCGAWGLGSCIPTTETSAHNGSIDNDIYICQQYFGKNGTPNADPGGEEPGGAIDYRDATCTPAYDAGIIPDISEHNDVPFTQPAVEYIEAFGMATLYNYFTGEGYSELSYIDVSGDLVEEDMSWWEDSEGYAYNPFIEATYQCDGADLPIADAACELGNDSDCNLGFSDVNHICAQGTCVVVGGDTSDVLPTVVQAMPEEDAWQFVRQFFGRIYSFWDYDDGQPYEELTTTPERFAERRFNDNSSILYDWRGAFGKKGTADHPATNELDIREAGDSYGVDENDGNPTAGVDENDGNPTAPVVVSVSDVCVNNNCLEGEEGTFSVNGSAGRVWNAQSSFLANVEFFAYPDPNQFPLRNIIVDWGDGMNTAWGELAEIPEPQKNAWGRGSTSGSTTDDNYYKAHRGLDVQQNPICSPSNEDAEWGMTPESCEPEPFRFQHHYKCTGGMLSWLTVNGRECEFKDGFNILENSPCYIGSTCVYQPRVYVRDNWDYCAGECDDPVTGLDCFDSSGAGECNQDAWPTTEIQDPVYWNPWINWAGTIEISPS